MDASAELHDVEMSGVYIAAAAEGDLENEKNGEETHKPSALMAFGSQDDRDKVHKTRTVFCSYYLRGVFLIFGDKLETGSCVDLWRFVNALS